MNTWTSTHPRPAAQYLRMSTDHQRYSMENQAAAILSYAAAEGYDVVKTYADAGRSGMTTKRRAGLSQLLADVVGGNASFETILVLDVSRWGRYQDPDEAGHYEFLCRSAGVNIVYCNELFGDNPASSVMKQLKRVMAGEYSRELSVKVRQGRQRHEQLGHCPGSKCPYGIQRQEMLPGEIPGRMLLRSERKSRPENSLRYAPGTPDEQAIARLIFQHYTRDAMSNVEIAAKLNRDGKFWQDGTPWTGQRIVTHLECELLAGRQWGNKHSAPLGEPNPLKCRDKWRLVRTFEPVVPHRLFEAARQRRTALAGSTGKTLDEMLADLRRLLKRYGRLSHAMINQDIRSSSADSYYHRFGSLTAAYAAIGYAGGHRLRGRKPDGNVMNKDEILEGLRQLEAKHGYVSMGMIHATPAMPSNRVIRSEFGSLPNAYRAAGVVWLRGRPASKVRAATECPEPIGGGRIPPLKPAPSTR